MRSLSSSTMLCAIARSAEHGSGSGSAPLDASTPVAGFDTPIAANGNPIRDAITDDNKGEVFKVPVTKAGKSAYVICDTAAIADAVYREMMSQGLKTIINGGMGTITKDLIPDEGKRQAEAMKIARERLAAMYSGTLKITGRVTADSEGYTAAEMTEARRLAKEVIKAQIRAEKGKISSYAASDITKAANAVLEYQPHLKEQARKNLASRPGLGPKLSGLADLGLAPDPKLEAKAEAAKAERKANAGSLSAAQAGKVKAHAPRATH